MSNKKAGENLVLKKKSSKPGGGVILSNGLIDSQIGTIEEQLKKAQDTLSELQSMKQKLEEDRQRKLEQERREKELEDAQVIKEENIKLKSELKSYQTEINSLKTIVASLKDDVTKNTEQLQMKVANSLKILEAADATLKGKIKNESQEELDEIEDQQDISDMPKFEIGKKDEEIKIGILNEEKPNVRAVSMSGPVASTAATATPQASLDNIQAQPTNPPVGQGQPSPQQVTPTAPSTAGQPTPPAAEPAPSATPNEPPKEVKAAGSLDIIGDDEEEEQAAPGVGAVNATANSSQASVLGTTTGAVEGSVAEEDKDKESIEDELLEYAEIKKELAALESDGIANSPAATVAEPEKKEEIEEEEEEKSSEHEAKDKEKPEKVTIKVLVKHDAKKDEDDKEEKKKEEEKEAKEEKKDEEKPRPKKLFMLFKKKARSKKREEEEKKEEEKKEEKEKNHLAEDKKRRRFTLLKKKHKSNEKDEEEQKKTQREIKADTKSGGFMMKAAIFLILLFIGGTVYQALNAEKSRKVYVDQAKGQVKGATANKVMDRSGALYKTESLEQRYKESFAEIPFEDTNWVNYKNQELGVNLDYPQNTSNQFMPQTTNTTVWFLRKNGYLMKISKTTTNQTLDQYWAAQKSVINYKMENTTFKNFPAIHLALDETMDVRGDIYLVKAGSDIYQIWYKTFQPGEDINDEQRVKRMIDTFVFTNAVPPPPAKTKKAKK